LLTFEEPQTGDLARASKVFPSEFFTSLEMHRILHKRVLETVARHGMIRAGDRVGLGVSGGADSVALLRIFADLRASLGITISVLHFHHQLRGAVADEDERFVKALAGKFGFQFESGRADVATEAKRNRWNLEDAARRLRYQFFASTAASHSLDCVAVAHTADDQAETVLSHLLRGSGITGLAGIHPVAGLIVRPLLDLRRAELREYLSSIGQAWREDATNQDTSRTRARIRHELIPFLERDFDPAAVTRLARIASHAREDEAFWRALEDERFCALTTRDAAGAISLDAADLLAPFPSLTSCAVSSGATRAAPAKPNPAKALTRRLVRRIYAQVRGSREQLTASHVDAVLDLAAKSQSGSAVDLPGMTVERIFNRLIFAEANVRRNSVGDASEAGAVPEFSYSLERPATWDDISIVVTEIHRRFNLKMVDWPASRSETVSGRGALDFDRVQWPVVLRNWRPGDSYRPQGSRRVRKLKRLLLETRVPRNVRKGWPVLDSAGSVIWASGCPVAEEVAVSGSTEVGLVIGEEEI
jgi:tRNA(Ile)-lysidine synthase